MAAAAAEPWANGVPTGKMERIARKMGMGRPSRDRVGAMLGIAAIGTEAHAGRLGFPRGPRERHRAMAAEAMRAVFREPGPAAAPTTCTDNSNLPGVTRLSFRT